MTLKHLALVCGAVACLNLISAAAAPWIGPGDARARFAVQKLADQGQLNRPVTSWPVMWASVESALAEDAGLKASPATIMARAYLEFEQKQQAASGIRSQLELSATADNWVFGAGAIDRWWGPGWQSSLIFSSNTRPMPTVWLNRKQSSAPETSWLSWIGPWQITVLAGEYEKERTVPDAKLAGIRVNLRPLNGLELGFSRVVTYRSETYRAETQEDKTDARNTLTSLDARYGMAVGNQSVGVYGQVLGEEESALLPTSRSWLLGSDWTSQLFNGDQQWFIEYANTLADDFLGDAKPNVTYDHPRYNSGYRYYGRTLGASFSGDAEAVTLGGFHFFNRPVC